MKIFISKQVKGPFKYKSGNEMGKSQGTGEQVGAVKMWKDWGRVKGLVIKWEQYRYGKAGEEKGLVSKWGQ